MEYYIAMKMNGQLLYTTTWVNFLNRTVYEKCQIQKNTNSETSLM